MEDRKWSRYLLVLAVANLLASAVGGNDYNCGQRTSCFSCVREKAHEAYEADTCVWCVGGTYDNTCRNTCDVYGSIDLKTGRPVIVEQPTMRQIDFATECPARACEGYTNCYDCIADTTPNVDCQWCSKSMKCVDFNELPYGCTDDREFRVTEGDGSDACPRRNEKMYAEMFFGGMGLLVLIVCLPCLFCRWCLLPWVKWIDLQFWGWRRLLIRSDDFGQGAAFDELENIMSVKDTAEHGVFGAGRLDHNE